MPEKEDLSFLEVSNLDHSAPEEHERYQDYWFAKTPGERLKEVMRLNIAKWGKEAFSKMDKTRIKIISLSDYTENDPLR